MLEAYMVISTILSMVTICSFGINAVLWAQERYNSYSWADPKFRAQSALYSLAALVPIWLWPLTIPLLLLYLIYVLFKEATASDSSTD
jgi:hypothetical protein